MRGAKDRNGIQVGPAKDHARPIRAGQYQANVLDSFKQVVTAPDGTVRGARFSPAVGGGIFYN